jgi:hypothetical protein
VDIIHDSVATKSDIQLLRSDLKSDVHQVRSDLKSDVHQLRSDLKSDVHQLRGDLAVFATKADLAEAKVEILKWMVSAIGIQTVVIIGAVIALVRVVPH